MNCNKTFVVKRYAHWQCFCVKRFWLMLFKIFNFENFDVRPQKREKFTSKLGEDIGIWTWNTKLSQKILQYNWKRFTVSDFGFLFLFKFKRHIFEVKNSIEIRHIFWSRKNIKI